MEKIYDVNWEGPFSADKILKNKGNTNHVLYAIYSTHPLYGKNALVYIGMTEQFIASRIEQHLPWIDNESDPVEIYAAYIGEFTTWETADNTNNYPSPDRDIIIAIESLLIFSHQPAYNTTSKNSAANSKNYRVFNTGKSGSLLPEVSGLYYLGD